MERPLHKLRGYNVQRTAHATKMTAGLGLQLWLEGTHCQRLRRAGQEPLRSLVVGNRLEQSMPVLRCSSPTTVTAICITYCCFQCSFLSVTLPCFLLPEQLGATNPPFLGLIYKVSESSYSLDEMIRVYRTVLERAAIRGLGVITTPFHVLLGTVPRGGC